MLLVGYGTNDSPTNESNDSPTNESNDSPTNESNDSPTNESNDSPTNESNDSPTNESNEVPSSASTVAPLPTSAQSVAYNPAGPSSQGNPQGYIVTKRYNCSSSFLNFSSSSRSVVVVVVVVVKVVVVAAPTPVNMEKKRAQGKYKDALLKSKCTALRHTILHYSALTHH